MHCPECSFKNPEKAKFCMECAASLISIDHSHLSKRSHQQLAGERKHATIMKSILKKIKTVQERISRKKYPRCNRILSR